MSLLHETFIIIIYKEYNWKWKKTHPSIIFRVGLTKEETMTKYNCSSNCHLRPASWKVKQCTEKIAKVAWYLIAELECHRITQAGWTISTQIYYHIYSCFFYEDARKWVIRRSQEAKKILTLNSLRLKIPKWRTPEENLNICHLFNH